MADDGRPVHGEPRVIKSAIEAREGVTGHGVRYVLLFGTAAVTLIFLGLWLANFR